MSRASAPGKILLAGEYSILEGGPAVVMAVDRRARAWVAHQPGGRSPFLAAAADAIAAELGPDSPSARAARTVRVDTRSMCAPGGAKLGLGSSAAATVAAIAACLDRLDRALLHRLAHRAHGDAQARLGARGSGADVAASVWGGCLLLHPAGPGEPPAASPLALPPGLELVPVWTGRPADTRALVAAVHGLSTRDPAAYHARIAELSAAAAAFVEACRKGSASAAVAAVAAGGDAVRELGRAAGCALSLDIHQTLRTHAVGGALKPTGAGGGDIALAAFDRAEAAEEFRAHVKALGMDALDLGVAAAGAQLEQDCP